MRLKHLLAGMLVAAPITAHAADVVTSLATPGDSGRVPGVVIYCPSSDGTRTAQGCTFGGSSTPSAPTYTAPANTGTGTDASNAAPTAQTLLQTLTVATPGAYRVQNQSAATVQMQLCPPGTSPTATSNCSTYLLAPGAGPNAQGADSSPEIPWFTGVIFVRGAAGAQVAGRSN